MDMLAYSLLEYNYLETFSKTFIIPVRQNQFLQENIFNIALIRRFAIALNTNSVFTGSFNEHPNRYQQFGLRHVRILSGSQSVVE